MLVPEAAKLKKKRWAIVYPNYEYGQSAAATFKEMLKKAQPDVEFVAEQAPPLGRIDAGAVVAGAGRRQARRDLQRAVRRRPGEVRARGQHARAVQGPRGGEPADRRARVHRAAARTRRRSAGSSPAIPYYGIQTARAQEVLPRATTSKYNEYPRLGSVVGYSTIMSIAEGIKKAKSTDTEKLIAAFSGLQVDDAVRPGHLPRPRPPVDDGRLRRPAPSSKGGKGVMIDYVYLDGAKYLPSDDEVKKLRRASTDAGAGARVGASCRRPPDPHRAGVGVGAVSRRQRAVADLRRHAHRQLRARLVLHARALRRGTRWSTRSRHGPLGFWRGVLLAALAVAALGALIEICCCAASTARRSCSSCSRPSRWCSSSRTPRSGLGPGGPARAAGAGAGGRGRHRSASRSRATTCS